MAHSKYGAKHAWALAKVFRKAGLNDAEKLRRLLNFRRNYPWVPRAQLYLDRQAKALSAKKH